MVGGRSGQADSNGTGGTGISLALETLGQMGLDLAGLSLRQGAHRPGVDACP